MSKYIVVGIDYGTRFTKVLFRDNNQVEGKAYVVTNPTFPDGLFPSLLSLNGESIAPFQQKGEVIAYLKMLAAFAVTKYEDQPFMALEHKDIKIPVGLNKLRGTYHDLDLVGLCLSYYLGCLVAEAHRCIKEKLRPETGDLVLYQLAIPTALTGRNREVEKFFWICLVIGKILFKKHGTRILQEISLSEIYDTVENDVASKFEEIKDEYQHRCVTYPETAAAVAGFFNSKTSWDGIFITADVGAGTVDLNIFRKNRPIAHNPDPTLAYYSTQVSPLGAQRLEDEFNFVTPMDADTLRDELYAEIRSLFVRALTRQPNHKAQRGHRTYDESTIFLFGGGKRHAVYKETLLQGLDGSIDKNAHHGGVFEPNVLELPDYPEIEKPLSSVSAGRYAVAFGLTTNPINLHKIILPDELDEIPRRPPDDDRRYGFDWSD